MLTMESQLWSPNYGHAYYGVPTMESQLRPCLLWSPNYGVPTMESLLWCISTTYML